MTQQGLSGIVAGQTAICTVGAKGDNLHYRGYSVTDLVKYGSFEETAYLLLYAKLPNAAELSQFVSKLQANLGLAPEIQALLKSLPANSHPMDILRTTCSFMGSLYPENDANSLEITLKLLVTFPAAIAYWYHYHQSNTEIDVNIEFKSVADYFTRLLFLHDLKDDKLAQLKIKSLDISLILYAEHEFNASTFAARVCSATLSDIYSAVAAAIGTLRGPLHGGANEKAMDLIESFATPEAADKGLRQMLSDKQLIMGFGHRVYKVQDPRSDIIKEQSRQLSQALSSYTMFEVSEVIENIMREEKKLFPNADFYSASCYKYCGIRTDLFTPLFVFSRLTGWVAHILEQRGNNKLIRPTAEYIGPEPLPYLNIKKRANMENTRPDFDKIIFDLADYINNYEVSSELALNTAKMCLADSIGCAFAALKVKQCYNLLGPWAPGQSVANGVRVLGVEDRLDPIKAAIDLGTLIRWIDFNDTWLAKEWGHPSDNLGGLLSVFDYLTQNGHNLSLHDLLVAMIKCYEIQGILALDNSFNEHGFDHVALVKIATAGVVAKLLGADFETIMHALSHAFLDGHSLRCYRHAPNTGSRKSWAAGDATGRGVRLAMLAVKGELACPSALTVPTWGFEEVYWRGDKLKLGKLGSYVMENILFKVSYPAEFHAQTAVECAIKCRQQIQNIENINKITIETQNAGYKIINKTGPLYNYADRDHSLQYMVAVALIEGNLVAANYSDEYAKNPSIDELRNKMTVVENNDFTTDYFDLNNRAIANKLIVTLKDGTVVTEHLDYPLGHPKRRAEAAPKLITKLEKNCDSRYIFNMLKPLLINNDTNYKKIDFAEWYNSLNHNPQLPEAESLISVL